MAIKIARVYSEPLYLVSGNGILRTEPNDDREGFTAYRKTARGDFELKSEDGKMNEEVALAFTSASTLEISEEDYYNKSREELYRIQRENAIQ